LRTYPRADPGRQTAKQKLIRSAYDSRPVEAARVRLELNCQTPIDVVPSYFGPAAVAGAAANCECAISFSEFLSAGGGSIDGRPVTLMVDTGANKTILNARSIGRVQLPVSQPVNQGAGIIGNALRLRVHVEIAHQCMFSQPVSVMSLEELSKRFQIPFDGLLGQDILNQFRSVRIDYKAHVIELER
jgi:hypothetical protein